MIQLQNEVSDFSVDWVTVINLLSARKVTADDFVLIEHYDGGRQLAKFTSEADKKIVADRFVVHFIYSVQHLFGKGFFTEFIALGSPDRRKVCLIEMAVKFEPILSFMYHRIFLDQRTKTAAEKLAKEAAIDVANAVERNEKLSLDLRAEVRGKLNSIKIVDEFSANNLSDEKIEEIFRDFTLTGNEGLFTTARRLDAFKKRPFEDVKMIDKYDHNENLLCEFFQIWSISKFAK